MAKQAKKPSIQTYSFRAWKNYLYNLAAVLTVAVVVGHYVDQCLEESWVSKGLYLFIFSFHMPLLFFLAGTFYRNLEQDKKRVRQTALFSFCLYILMKLVIGLVRAPFTGTFSFSLFREGGAPWIFFALAVFFLVAQVMGRVSKALLLSASVILALVCGYTDKIGDLLVLSRLIVFFPFFVCGWMTGIERAESWTGKTSLRILGAAALILALITATVMCRKVYFMRPMFTGRNAYTSLGGRQLFGPAYRLLAYGVSAVLAAAVLAVTPRRSLGKLTDALGERALAVFFWHRPILYLLTSLWGYSAFEQALGWKIGRIAWVLCGLVCAAILSIRIFQRPFLALYRVIERPREFPRRLRDGVASSLPIDSRKKCVGWYSVTFVFLFIICFCPFHTAGKTLIWNPDGNTFHIPGLMVYGNYLRNLVKGVLTGHPAFSQFDFSIGYGHDALLFALPSYAEPINMLGALVPENYAEYLYVFLIIVRFYLIGISFLAFCFHMDKDNFSSYVGSLAYTFCGFTIVACKHPYFLTAMICLPLLLIGVENILRTAKFDISFTLLVFISAISSYYFLWMNTLFCVVYFLLRFLETAPRKGRGFFQRAFAAVRSYLLGLGMGAVYFIPNIWLFLNSTRQDTVLDPSTWPVYPENYIKRLFGYLVSPWVQPGNWTVTSYAALGLISLLVLFLAVKKKPAIKVGYILMLTALALPVCGLVMMAFTSVGNRWSYQLALLTAVVIIIALEHMDALSDRVFLRVFIGICVFVAYVSLTPATRNEYSLVGSVLLLLTFIVFYIARRTSSSPVLSQILISGTVIVCIAVNGLMSFSPEGGNYVREFHSYNDFNTFLDESPYAAVKSDSGTFSRIDTNNLYISYRNSSIPLNVTSTNLTFNALDGRFFSYLSLLEDADIMNGMVYDGLDNRTFLMSLNQVGYWTSKEGDFNPPFGYKKIDDPDGGNGFTAYENERFIPLGFTYEKAMDESVSYELSALEKQEAMMQAVILEDGSTDSDAAELDMTSRPVAYEVISSDGITNDGGVYRIDKANATIQIKFDKQPNAEQYLVWEGMDISANGAVRWTLTAKDQTDGHTVSWRVDSPTFAIPHVTSGYTINLGYTQEGGEATYTITFPSKGTFTLDSLEVYAQSMENYASYVDKLSEDTLEDLEIGLNTVSGTISLDREKYLYFSIPYSTGWRATVDGERADILRANIAFMAIPVGPGDHEIVLTYHTPGLAIGAGISAASLALLLVLLRRERHRRPAETEVPERI